MVFNMIGAPSGGYSGYQIDQSMVLDGSSDYLSRTPASQGDTRTFTVSCVVRRFETQPSGSDMIYTAGTGTSFIDLFWFANDRIRYAYYNGSTYAVFIETDAVFRDLSSWYHIVLALDTTAATASDRVKIWVNGILQSVDSNQYSGYGAQNTDVATNRTNPHNIAKYVNYGEYGNLALADFRFIDGTAYDASEFGEFYEGSNKWRLIEPSGLTYGTNGFYLPFTQDTPNLGVDYSGNGNDWTENGSPVKSSDSPTRNICTLNELTTGTTPTLSNGNLTMATTSGADLSGVVSTIAPQSGKWYWECEVKAASTYPYIGIAVQTNVNGASAASRGSYFSAAFRPSGAFASTTNELGTITGTTTGVSFATNDVLMFALDCDNNKLFMGKNGTWFNSADPVAGTNEQISWVNSNVPIHAAISGYNGQGNGSTFRFASDDWSYTAPTDFIEVSAANLPEVTITDPGEYFNAVGYTGDGTAIGSGGQAITGVGFQSDFTWIKNRDNTNNHVLFDVLRGATNNIRSNTTEAEVAIAESLASFDADGFTVGSNGIVNSNTNDYISWNWKAGGAGVPNTDGTISSTVSVNDDAGFSIVGYTGTGSAATVGHGQSAAPEMIIVKNRDIVSNWITYHHLVASDPETDYLLLDTTGVVNDLAAIWNDTAPTSTTFSVGTNTNTNGSTNELVAYCFRSIPGYSKVFSYTANGSTDGPFVYLGFAARFILIKSATRAEGWYIYDTERSAFNEVDDILRADRNNAESIQADIDVNSNGIKMRTDNAGINLGSNIQIGIAFAENPFGGSNIPLGLAA